MTNLDVRVYPVNDSQSSTKAFASVSVDDLIAIRGIRIVEGTKGLFVTMPQSKDQDGNYHDIAFPVTGELRKATNKAILDEFKVMSKNIEKATGAPQKSDIDKASSKKAIPNEFEL